MHDKIRGRLAGLMALSMWIALATGCDDGGGDDDSDADLAPTPDGALPDAAPPDAADPDTALPDAGPGEPEPIDIIGAYLDAFDTPHRIDAAGWSQGPAETASLTRFTAVDNTTRTAIGQNDAAHPFAPDAWSRFDYSFTVDQLWYCQSAFDAPDEATARATPAPDDADPATGGCGGFAWSALTPATPLAHLGHYIDDFATPYTLEPARLTIGAGAEASRFVLTDVTAAHAIARNADTNGFNPGAWSRFDLATVDGVLYLCQSAYDAPSAAAARAASADASAPATGGCSMFAWSVLRPDAPALP